MTDADDEGLIDQFEVSVIRALSGVNGEPDYDEAKAALADRLEAQGKEIAELRKELYEARDQAELSKVQSNSHLRAWLEANAALAEALQVIAPFAEIAERMGSELVKQDIFPTWYAVSVPVVNIRAAAAFAKKHGGKDQ